MKTDRRTFLKQIGLLALCAASGPEAVANKVKHMSGKRLTILHTNDVHSHIDPFPADDHRYPNLGGYARRQAYINNVIAEGNETLIFECGDMFQGTPYFNFYKGKLEIELMNNMHIDAVTIGNHEFDNGLDVLCDRIQEANFPFVNANYEFTDKRAQSLVKPYIIKERCGIKIGIFGMGVMLEGLVTAINAKGTIYHDPVEVAQKTADILKAQGCQMVIAISHLGYKMENDVDDCNVAANTRNIDMILGGHTHTFLPSPVMVKNLDGKDVLVNQVGYAGINVGRIDVHFNGDTFAFETNHPRVMDSTLA